MGETLPQENGRGACDIDGCAAGIEEQASQGISAETARRRKELFDRYIRPYFNMVFKLCAQYTDNYEDVKENYATALTTLYKGIETYDPEREIKTWIHIVVKRQVFEVNRRRAREDRLNRDRDINVFCDDLCDTQEGTSYKSMTIENYRELYNDDILAALDSMKPMYKNALLLQMAGYSLQEIAEIEFNKGNFDSRNINTVKSRLFLARQYMREKITRDGKRKAD